MYRTAAAALSLLLLAPAAGRAEPPADGGSEKVIALVLFPDITLLDLVGPLQVLKSLPAPYRVVVVGERKEPMTTDVGLALTPERTFAEVPRPFAVIVPGGPGSVAAMGNEAVQGYLRSAAPRAEVVGSVCTGGLVLAATGLLEGRRATTHWAYARELEKLGAHYVRERWVEDSKFITAGGVSAGIDMAIALAARLTDRATAQRIQLGIEYDPHPPWGGIDWSQVGEKELARQRQGGTGRRLADAPRLLAGRPDLLKRLGARGAVGKGVLEPRGQVALQRGHHAFDLGVRVVEVGGEADPAAVRARARRADDAVLFVEGERELQRVEGAGLQGHDGRRARGVGVRPHLDLGELPEAGHQRLGQLLAAVLDGRPADLRLELERFAEGLDGGLVPLSEALEGLRDADRARDRHCRCSARSGSRTGG